MALIKLLDCTLRDGGYINDWEFGNSHIISIFERLISANVDIVEVGFLDQNRNFDPNRTIMPNSKAVESIYGKLDKGNSLVVGMIDYGTCEIQNLLSCKDSFLDGIRIIFKKEVMHEAIEFCNEVKKLGYLVFAQAVSITSYNDEELNELINMVNELEPYAFSLVDTYGLLHKGQLMHYYTFANQHLKDEIGIGYHAHNNFQLAYSNCIELVENAPAKRMLIIDGSLYGMGKNAGNAPIELLVMYMNENFGKEYHCSQLLEAIDATVSEIFRKTPWGYSLKFYLSASHDCHPNYLAYLMEKKKLSIKSISEILDSISREKKLLYDKDYIEFLYREYQKVECDDKLAIEELKTCFAGKHVLLLGPGKHVLSEKESVDQYILEFKPIIISINYIPEEYDANYIFISNAKRYRQVLSKINNSNSKTKVIATSNITKTSGNFDYFLNYSDLLDEEALIVDNPMIMLARLLNNMKVREIALAGFDGFVSILSSDYINPNMAHAFSAEQAKLINVDVELSYHRIAFNMPVKFITTTIYRIGENPK